MRTCPNCGMSYYEWLHEDLADLQAGNDPLIPNIHECPKPYPYETALMLASLYTRTGVPTSQRQEARIRLGLVQGVSS